MRFVCDTCGEKFEKYMEANAHQQEFPEHYVMWEQEFEREVFADEREPRR